MTTYNPEHAAFVGQQFRYKAAENAAVKTLYPKARSIKLDSNMDEASAAQLAADLLTANENPAVIEVTVDGLMSWSDFNGGPPRYSLQFGRFPTGLRTMTVVGFTSDINSNTTTLKLRG